MNKEVEKIYKIKIKELQKHNKLYYDNDSPSISDSEYDKLKRETINLEDNNKFLKKFGSVKNIVGSQPSNKFKKIKHTKPMLSLSNAFDKDDVLNFLKKIWSRVHIK